MKAIVAIACFIILFSISFAKPALAVSISITSFPSSISNDSFSLTASVSGATAGTNYLRVDIYKDGTSNYFGETYNNSDWYSGSDGKSYFPITIDSNKNGIASLQARIGTPNSNDYPGPGSYKVRLRRYTSSGSLASSDDQSPIDINISYSFPTQTPTPEPTNTPTATLTPTKTPTPTPSPTSKIVSPTISKDSNSRPSEDAPVKIVLGDSTETSPTMGPTIVRVASAVKNNLIGIIFIFLGVILTVLCGIVVIWPYKDKIKEKLHL